MGETTTLTIRLDEELKQRVEKVAAAEDRSVSEYVIRALKERLEVQCPSCGRSSGVSTLPAGLSPQFTKWVDEARRAKEMSPFYVTVDEAGQRIVYWGQHRGLNTDICAMLPIDLMLGDAFNGGRFGASIPFGAITGWGWDMEGREYARLVTVGYVDGNAAARQIARARFEHSQRRR